MPAPKVRVLASIEEVAPEAWDALLSPASTPFLRHAWLAALEGSGAAAPRAGWTPRHLALFRGRELVAAAPAYLKEDSDGDFSRDWGWAEAAGRAGLPYHPKLVATVPFTPCTGERLLVAAGEDRPAATAAIVGAIRDLAARDALGSAHVLFPTDAEAAALEAAGLARRLSYQYHWQNEGYASYDEFLARFPSKKRHQLRRERAAAATQGLSIRTVRGEELARDAPRWAKAAFTLHRTTVDKLLWGRRWLGRGFYDRIFATMPEHLEVVAAERDGALVAGAFNVSSATRLYGRYWGALEEHPFLHFHVCLYHSIDDCIRRGLEAFEGGAGGEHKIPRGFLPTPVHSAHLFFDPTLDRALRAHVRQEREARAEALDRFFDETPVFKPEPR